MKYLDQLFDLKGRVAVVIGATGGLCGQIAVGLAKAGCEVVVSGRNADRADERLAEIEAAGAKAYFVECEITDRASVQSLINTVDQRSGRIDILVNGAGINRSSGFFEISEDELDQMLDVDLKGLLRSCQMFGEYFMRHDHQASIINIGSVAGINPISQAFTYSACKAAVHNLSRNLAREWAEYDIRVNTLVPGFFPAEETRAMLDESRMLEILRQTPMSRFGNPEELIGAALLLASPRAGRFITGAEIVVDGGFSCVSL